MCGIAGFFDTEPRLDAEALKALAGAMARTLHHRGPDGSDVWADAEAGVAFGHTRLSIIDLSPAGAQPMRSGCGRFVITYNGEVYNAPELRAELEAAGRRFRGHSDTEVIVEGCAAWGVEATVKRLIGMFAFAAWDALERRLTLVRDRLGIKPLYWGRRNGRLMFGSELKALRALPDWQPEIDLDAVAAYLRHNCIPAPHSIYRGIRKLEPGKLVEVRADGTAEVRAYWSLADAARRGRADVLDVSDDEALAELERLLGDAVKRRMVSDVPLGAFLSGGIDSSAVVALMQAASDRPVRTFSIGFHDERYNEARHAKKVAAHLGTDHTEQYVTAEEARDVIPMLPAMYDEPFADSSQIPTFLVSRIIRDHVTVALSGDGGDELFAGYNRYVFAATHQRQLARFPMALRRAGARGLRLLSPRAWDKIFLLAPARVRPRVAGDKLHKLATVLDKDEDAFYRQLVSHWTEPEAVVLGATEPRGLVWDDGVREVVPAFIARMQYLDTLTYLPDDILTKVDRASMAVSLEARVPILDHRVVELAWRLPHRFKVRNGKTKWLLRQLLYKHVPERLLERPKMGFGMPIDEWLRGPLRDWCESLLDPKALGEDGLFDPAPIRRKWDEHLSGKLNWQYLLWDILMFQAWKAEAMAPAQAEAAAAPPRVRPQPAAIP